MRFLLRRLLGLAYVADGLLIFFFGRKASLSLGAAKILARRSIKKECARLGAHDNVRQS